MPGNSGGTGSIVEKTRTVLPAARADFRNQGYGMFLSEWKHTRLRAALSESNRICIQNLYIDSVEPVIYMIISLTLLTFLVNDQGNVMRSNASMHLIKPEQVSDKSHYPNEMLFNCLFCSILAQ